MTNPRSLRARVNTRGAGHWQRTGEHPAVAVRTAAQTARFLTAIVGHRLYAGRLRRSSDTSRVRLRPTSLGQAEAQQTLHPTVMQTA